jgi:ABC-2 type transport system permease protein
VLFSRDLRHRSIVLYLARPLPPALFALTRWASLASAILVFTLLPTLVLYGGGLLAGLDTGDETPVFLRSVALQLMLAALLAGITGLISSVALRRGFAVVASILALIVVAGVVLIVQEIAAYEGIEAVGEIAGLFSPWALHNGLAQAWEAGGRSTIVLTDAWAWTYLATALVVCAACLALLVRRFVKVGSR